jgi:hypothetical protein
MGVREDLKQRLKATGLADLSPTSIAGLHFIDGLQSMVGTIIDDPGKHLLRFPFNLLPARWILSDNAMKAITIALMLGVTIDDKTNGSRQAEAAVRAEA